MPYYLQEPSNSSGTSVLHWREFSSSFSPFTYYTHLILQIPCKQVSYAITSRDRLWPTFRLSRCTLCILAFRWTAPRRIALVAICFIWLFVILIIGITFGVHNGPVTYRGKVYTYLAIFECSTPQQKKSNLCSRSLLLVNLQLLYKKHRHYGHPRTNVVHAYWVLLIIQQWNERIRIPIKVRVNCKAK